MNQPSKPDASAPGGDPWAAFGYMVAGVAFYGVIGWGLSVWLHADYWIPIGILAGLGLGMYLVFSRYRIGGTEASGSSHGSTHDRINNGKTSTHNSTPSGTSTTDASEPRPDDAAPDVRPDSDDRGETA
ncbi:AtpZ/AtpI family protein [Jatrophihabitans telluris]|uniref:AtpZ/AtpI family protein n=1 Tax=Jatrophihabitans telluris TaxID=2038343 RepID=A0ABY4R3I3_9ACTN|nr:AtpZ/AtpI family protein [Jatrophihabitans telluris]UQX89862.1 AtpZ/AtpI family protein [Jatrophihabitans telluris]